MDNVTLIRVVSGTIALLTVGLVIFLIARQKRRSAAGEELKGIGGWLLWFVIQMTIGSVIWVGSTVSYFIESKPTAGLLAAVGSAVCVQAVYLLIRRRPNAIKWSLISLFYNLALSAAPMVIVLVTQGNPEELEKTSPTLARAAVGTVVWGWYLLSSKRVRNTYAQPGPLSDAF